MKKLTLVLALLIFSSPAWGKELTIKDFLDDYDLAPLEDKPQIHNMMRHKEMGMSWSNAVQEKLGGKPLYYLPKNLRLTGEQAFQIFREEVERAKAINEIANLSGMFLLAGLMRTFPCK